ncbi:MAG: AAA family ATPase [Bacillota bacterium]|nr:AAA family ATPase [Bacillota bacterium]
MSHIKSFLERLESSISKAILGKSKQAELLGIAFLCGGHVLMEDLPGTGKTMMMRAFAKTVGGKFSRIQLTPDVMPSDVTGISFFNMKEGEFEFREGPVFANIVLADEINRASPRTQSGLLEAMAEGQVTVDGKTYPMEQPFMVVATQNPLESFGTFPLPEAQLDRFMMKLSLGYMDRSEELDVARRKETAEIIEELQSILQPDELEHCRREADLIHFGKASEGYLMDIVDLTRNNPHFRAGVSTRSVTALHKASRILAAARGREYVLPEDVKYLAPYMMAHRCVYRDISDSNGKFDFFIKMLEKVEVPTEELR